MKRMSLFQIFEENGFSSNTSKKDTPVLFEELKTKYYSITLSNISSLLCSSMLLMIIDEF